MIWLGPLATEYVFAPADPVLGGALTLINFSCFVSAGVGIEEDPGWL